MSHLSPQVGLSDISDQTAYRSHQSLATGSLLRVASGVHHRSSTCPDRAVAASAANAAVVNSSGTEDSEDPDYGGRRQYPCPMQQAAASKPSVSGVDHTLLEAALRRTPRERFQRGIHLYRIGRWLRAAKRVSPVTHRT